MGSIFKKAANVVKKTFRVAAPVAGFLVGGPVGAAVAYKISEDQHAAHKNRKMQKNAMRAEEEMLSQYERSANQQAELARREREELQRQESDAVRSKRKKGRRSLMGEAEMGNDAMPLRRTLG